MKRVIRQVRRKARSQRAGSQRERITVSLSRDSAGFLRAFRARVNSPSMSALFEKIVSDLQGRTESEELDEKVKAYYDGLSPSGVEENHAWGKLGQAALESLTEEEGRSRPHPAKVGR